MQLSWFKVQQEFNLHHIKFEDYFKNIGRPFFDILKKIGVKKNHTKILNLYKKESIKHKRKIIYYYKTLPVLKKLKQKKFILNIVTSKDFKRTKQFLGKNIDLFSNIQCLDIKILGKPNPYQINKIIKKSRIKKSKSVYIGDTHIDYLTAKNANIDFIFCQWGYGKNYNYKNKGKTISDLLSLLKLKEK